MTSSTKKLTITPESFEYTSVTPAEKEILASVDLEKGLEFFEGQVTVHVANRLERRQKAYRLLYDLYFQMGITQANNDGLWLSIHDALPETTTFVTEDDQGGIMGALTIVFDSSIGLPADDLYKKEIDQIRNAGEKVCEIVSFGTNNEGKASIKIVAALFYCVFLYLWQKENATAVVITVHSDYEDFYCRRVSFKKLGPERKYAKVNGAPTVLLNLSLPQLNKQRHQRHIFPFYMLNHSSQDEHDFTQRIENMIVPMTDEEFFTFFIDKTNIWEKASPQKKDFIKKIYPPKDVNHYEVSRALAKGFSKKYRNAGDTRSDATKIVGR